MSTTKPMPEVLRTSYDADGVKVEFLHDEARQRYTVATRWVNLAHFVIPFPTERSKRLAHERASAVFEAVCMDGATKEVAMRAKRIAKAFYPSHCINLAGFEREVLRRAGKAQRLAAGYVTYTGRAFTQANADAYNRLTDDIERERYEPTKAALMDQRHQLFVAIANQA